MRTLPPLSAADASELPLASAQFDWTPRQKVVAHRNMHHLFPTELIEAGPATLPLPAGPQLADLTYWFGGEQYWLDDYFRRTHVAGLLVLKDGLVVQEKYACGNDEHTVWASRSVAKSVTSTLMGIALHEGAIRSLDEKVGDYIPELRGTLYEDVTLRQNLRMTSGQPHDSEFPSILAFHACMVKGEESGCFLRVLKDFAKREDARPPGTMFAYHSADVIVSGIVVQRAVGCTLAEYLQKKLWQPFGMERAAGWNLEAPGGQTFANSGLSACLRDWGRFGLFLLREGELPDGTRLLGPDWIREATTPSEASLRAGKAYGFNWWMTHGPGVYAAHGNAGQRILIDPAERVVIAKWATWNNPPAAPSAPAADLEDAALFAAIVEHLKV